MREALVRFIFCVWIGVWLLLTGIPEAWPDLWTSLWRVTTGEDGPFPGPRFLPASWVLIYDWLPDNLYWVWPWSFILAGLFLVAGVVNTRAMMVGCIISGVVYFVWGSTSIYGWLTNQGGTIPGSAAYYILSGIMAMTVHRVWVMRKLGERVAQIVESDARGG